MSVENKSKWKWIFPLVMILEIVIIILSVFSYAINYKELPGEYIRRERVKLPIELDYIWYPSFNKAGDKIIFEGYDKWDSSYMNIYIWDFNKEILSIIPIDDDCKYPRFSNNGKYIVYSSRENGTLIDYGNGYVKKGYNLWVTNLNGSWRKQYTFNGSHPIYSAFSIDDGAIFFTTVRDTVRSIQSDIYRINFDGTNLTRITNDTAIDSQFTVLNNDQIIYTSTQAGTYNSSLFLLNISNGSKTQIIDMEVAYPSVDKYQNVVFQYDKNIYLYNMTDKKLYRYTNDQMIFASPNIDYSGSKIVICGKGGIYEPYRLFVLKR